MAEIISMVGIISCPDFLSIVASLESVLQRDTRTSFLFRIRMALDYDMRKTIAARLCLRKKKSKRYQKEFH